MNSISYSIKTIAQALQDAQSHGLDRLEAQLLMLHVLDKPLQQRAWLLSHDTDVLDALSLQRFEGVCGRRAHDEPIAYITGSKEFFGLHLQIDSRVLDPRADTETLVDWGLDCLTCAQTPLVLDLGTGSGAVALALASSCPIARVYASDASADALAVAAQNADRLGLKVSFGQGSWFSNNLPEQRYDLIVSNPPYLAADDPHLATLTHEPLQALSSGADGLDDIRLIVCDAPAHLRPDGWLLLEHGYDQAAAVRELLTRQGFAQVQSRKDLKGIERCSGAKWLGTRINEIITPL